MAFTIKRGDQLPVLTATLSDTGGAFNLSGATVRLTLAEWHTRTPLLDRVAATNLDDGAEGNRGKVQYTWAAGDTDTPGWYRGEWEVTFDDGRTLTFPNDDDLIVCVREDLA